MSTHEDLLRTHPVEGGSDRSFGLVFGALCVAIGLYPLLEGGPFRWFFLIPGGAFLATALIRPRVLAPLNRQWKRLGLVLGGIVSPIALAVVFFGVMTPIGLAMRALGRDPLKLRRDPGVDSYWQRRDPPGPDPETLPRQF